MKGRTFLAGLILAVSLTGTACATKLVPLPKNHGTHNPPPPPPSQSQEYHRPGTATPPPPPPPEKHKPLPPRDDKGHRLPPPRDDKGHRLPPPDYRRPVPGERPGEHGRGPVPMRPPMHRPEYKPGPHKDVPPPLPPHRPGHDLHQRPHLPPERRY